MKRILLTLNIFFGFLLLINDTSFPQAEFFTGSLNVDVGSYGRIRLYSTNPTDTTKHIERISILVGVSENEVFDYQNDIDIEEALVLVTPSSVADHEIYGVFNNAYSALPPDILQKLNIYGWNGGSYVIIKNTLINRETAAINAVIGLDFIAEVDNNYGFDTVTFNAANQIMDTYRGGTHVGFKYLSHQLNSLTSITWYDAYYADTSYWKWLNHGAIDDFFVAGADGPVSIPALSPMNINPGDSVTVYFAVAVGADEAAMLSSMAEAEAKYNATSISSDNIIPDVFSLEQNYPNPFNPSTKISFNLPAKENVTLKVYNTLGQEISTLINTELEAGKYTFDFNAGNLASGTYFYRINAGLFSSVKKMIITK